MKEYRYLNIPEQHSKGKPYIILALHRQGKTEEAARECRAALDHAPGEELRQSIHQECEPR